MSNFGRNLALWVIIGLLLVALFNLFQQPSNRGAGEGIAFSEFLAQVENGQVKEVTIKGHEISGFYGNEGSFKTYAPDDPQLVERLRSRGVTINALPVDDGTPSLFQILISWFPMLLLIGVWIFFMRQMQSGGGEALSQAHRAVDGDIAGVTESLGTAFNSTFIALLISIVVMFLVHQLQLLQERQVFDTQTYIDHNLIRHMQVRGRS